MKNLAKSVGLALVLSSSVAGGATTYVDNTLGSDCQGDYSTAARACSGSDGDAYVKIQDAIDAMNVGDVILLREGTYRETNQSADADILIPSSKNGDSWDEGHYNTLASYPGEWAIIDGEFTAPKGVVLGLKGMTYCPNCVLRYWKFERLEITGGSSPGDDAQGGAGLWLPEGPFIIRYCYLHDNWDDTQLNNPSGVTAYRLQNSTIEFNYFQRNGCADGGNCRQFAIFADYCDEAGQSQCQSPPFTGTVNDLERAARGNVFRYNLFDGGPEIATIGLGYKATQLLDPNDGSAWTNMELGDRMHHNIFLDHHVPAKLSQDYLQFHNNIADGGFVSHGQYHTHSRLRLAIYNNTVLDAGIASWSRASATEDNEEPFVPRDFVLSNLLAHSPSANNETRAINFGAYVDNTPPRPTHCDDIDTSHFAIDHNYLYDSQSSTETYMSGEVDCGSCYGPLTLAEFDGCYQRTNYAKPSSEGSDPLFEGDTGADAYTARAEHQVADGVSIADAGLGGDHPYLPSVTLPEYVGATNPADHQWVAGVMGLADVATLQAAGPDDPPWVEGGPAGGGGTGAGGVGGGGGVVGGGSVGGDGGGVGGTVPGAAPGADDEGCGCRLLGQPYRGGSAWLLPLAAGLAVVGRRRGRPRR